MQKELFDTPIYGRHSHVHENGSRLLPSDKVKLEKSARSLEEKVKELFIKLPASNLTAEEVKMLIHSDSPLTSFRRALTNLTYDKFGKFLTHTPEIKKMGSYGVMIGTYKLSNPSVKEAEEC